MNASAYMKHWRGKCVWKRLAVPVHQQRFKRCASLVLGASFIDVGCALGHSTHYLAQYRPGEWSGMDFDTEAVADARAAFPQYEFYYSPDYKMLAAVEGKRFDSVVCSEVLEHVENDADFASGLVSLARRRIVLTTPAVQLDDPGHLRVYTRRAIEALFAGLRCRIERISRFWYVTVDLGAGGKDGR